MMAFANVASAELVNGINFLSAEYDASGEFEATILTGLTEDGENYPIWGMVQDSYYFSSQSNPIDYNYSYSHSNVDSFGYDYGDTSVYIGHNSGHLSVDTYASLSTPWMEWGVVNSYTTGIWHFQPQYSDMELRFDIDCMQGWGESIGSISLCDNTAGFTLISESLNSNNYDYIVWTLNNNPSYSVDPTHTYSLVLETRGSSQRGEGYLGGGISAEISAIPEPATLLLLGLGCLALRKRR